MNPTRGQEVAAQIPAGFEATGPPLGAGSTAVVWPVRRIIDGREFALKVWRRPLSDAYELDRFRREVREHAELNRVSGHVVTYAWSEEAPTDGGTPWIGTHRHGTSLHDVLEGGRPPLPERLVLGADLLQGLADMHLRHTLHRDVKPANVLVYEGRAMLCDFGLVMGTAAYTSDNAAGTPRFVAPELLDGSSQPSARTDVYSAARTLQEALGRDIPPTLEQLLTAAASVRPGDRPADADEFAAAFRKVCRDLGHDLPPPLAAPRSGRSAPTDPDVVPSDGTRARGRARWLGAGAAAVALGAAGLVFVPDWQHIRGSAPSEPTVSTADRGPFLGRPDAGEAEPDITSDGRAVVLAVTTAGHCEAAVEGSTLVDEQPFENSSGIVVAVLQTYYGEDKQQACAKLVKPKLSPYAGVRTHLALTLCGDGNSCDHDWNAYPSDAGPTVVPSREGCVSYRVSMLDETGNDWLIRDDIGWIGCD